MDEVQTFSNIEFGTVRTVIEDGEPWFVGKDVADILGYKNYRDALRKRVDEEDKGVAKIDTLGGDQGMTIINESGLYSLILSSKMPNAKKFRRWVTDDVLKSIRKNGAYATPAAIERWKEDPESLIAVLTAYNDEKKANRALREEVAIQHQQLLEMQPKVTYCDEVLKSSDPINITVIAKDYGWSGQRMNKYLHEKGIQYQLSHETWLLYQKYADKGYTISTTTPYTDSLGMERTKIHTKWTQKGRLFIYETLKNDGILPNIEREVAS